MKNMANLISSRKEKCWQLRSGVEKGAGIRMRETTLISFLQQFDAYPFTVKLEGKEYRIGEGKSSFTVRFNRMISLSELASNTSLALGEAYVNKDIEIEGDLFYALDHFLGQMSKFSKNETALQKLRGHSLSKKHQEREVRSHYDIGNDFYRLWLDDTMSYSCGYFRSGDDSLYQAQKNKVDYILQKLYLKEGMTLLDVGCGWGYLLIEAARKYHIHGTGITLSVRQYEEFKRRIQQEGLEDFLQVELMDYRDLPKSGKRYDRVVSVGMIEHVGRDNYQSFFDCVNDVLKEKGIFLLHFISALKEHSGDPWINKYIFPGGMIPSLREIIHCSAEDGLRVLDVESLRNHYFRTLLCWKKNFNDHVDDIREMFDERFIRMWDLYLASCAATFHNGIIDLHQIVMVKGVNNDLPLTRWYSL